VAAKGSEPAQRLVKALDAVAAHGAGVLPLLESNVAPGIDRRLADLRLSLEAHPVTLVDLPGELLGQWVTTDGRTRVEVFPKGNASSNKALRRFAAAVQRIAPNATGTPITIQESARTVSRAFAVAGAIAIIAIALLLLAVLRRVHDVLLVLAPLILAGLL